MGRKEVEFIGAIDEPALVVDVVAAVRIERIALGRIIGVDVLVGFAGVRLVELGQSWNRAQLRPSSAMRMRSLSIVDPATLALPAQALPGANNNPASLSAAQISRIVAVVTELGRATKGIDSPLYLDSLVRDSGKRHKEPSRTIYWTR